MNVLGARWQVIFLFVDKGCGYSPGPGLQAVRQRARRKQGPPIQHLTDCAWHGPGRPLWQATLVPLYEYQKGRQDKVNPSTASAAGRVEAVTIPWLRPCASQPSAQTRALARVMRLDSVVPPMGYPPHWAWHAACPRWLGCQSALQLWGQICSLVVAQKDAGPHAIGSAGSYTGVCARRTQQPWLRLLSSLCWVPHKHTAAHGDHRSIGSRRSSW